MDQAVSAAHFDLEWKRLQRRRARITQEIRVLATRPPRAGTLERLEQLDLDGRACWERMCEVAARRVDAMADELHR